MPLDDIVNVNIVTESPGVSQAGFGIPLLLGYQAPFSERVRFYRSLAEVDEDFQVTDPERNAARLMFSQQPSPNRVAIGKGINPPTQRYEVSIESVQNDTEYVLFLDNTELNVLSDTDATNDEILSAFETQINGILNAGVTVSLVGTIGIQRLQIEVDTPGEFHRVFSPNTNLLAVTQNHASPGAGLTEDLIAIQNENDSWYGLVTLFNSSDYIQTVANFVESNEKLYVADSLDTSIIDAPESSATDIAKILKDSAQARTVLLYHPDPRAWAAAAWAGKFLPTEPGSVTWAFKTLAGIPSVSLSSTNINNLNDKKANFYREVGGVNITQPGIVSAGEFIDVIRFRDFLKARMQERIFGVLVSSQKVPFTDAGIALLQGEVQAQLEEGIEIGGLAQNPEPVVTVPRAVDVSAIDKAARILRNVSFTATLAGAIHQLEINGTISV